MLIDSSLSNGMKRYLFVTMLTSSFVLFEPSPYDLLLIFLIIAGLLMGLYRFSEGTILPILILLTFLMSNLFSIYFVKDTTTASMYVGITFYLALSWLAIVGLGQRYRLPLIKVIFGGYLISGCIAAIVGIIAYFHLLPSSETFLMFDRAKAFFKDPNVFGPFLVIPALFALYMSENDDATHKKKIGYIMLFLLLAVGIIVSFSRAAWANLAISMFIYMTIVNREWIAKRLKTIALLLLFGIPALVYFISTPLVQSLFLSRLGFQHYDIERFDTQRLAFLSGFDNPLGWGPGQAEVLFHIAPHNLFARLITENGFLGLLSLLALIGFSLMRTLTHYLKRKDSQGRLFLIIFSCLVGLIFNSFFIDTLHWRHFWLLLALAWASES